MNYKYNMKFFGDGTTEFWRLKHMQLENQTRRLFKFYLVIPEATHNISQEESFAHSAFSIEPKNIDIMTKGGYFGSRFTFLLLRGTSDTTLCSNPYSTALRILNNGAGGG